MSTSTETGSSTSSRREHCLCHSKRGRGLFQHLINCVRDPSLEYQILSASRLRKLGGAVCSCHAHDYQQDLDEDINETKMGMMEASLKKFLTDSGCPRVVSCLERLASVNSVTGSDGTPNISYQRLVYILDLATRRDYYYLNYTSQRSNTKKETSSTSEPEKQIFEETFTIKFTPMYLGLLFGKKGHNLKELSRLYACEIKVLTDCSAQSFSFQYKSEPKPIYFKIKAKDESQLPIAHQALVRLSQKITSERSAHEKRVEAYRRRLAERFRQRQARRHNHRCTPSNPTRNEKEAAKEIYSTKYHHMLKEKSERKSEKSQDKVDVLLNIEARCTNCHTEYSPDIENGPLSCQYHEGFIKLEKLRGKPARWSCCPTEVNPKDITQYGQQESHKDTGCKKGQHIWRSHRKSASKCSAKSSVRGAEQKSFTEELHFVL